MNILTKDFRVLSTMIVERTDSFKLTTSIRKSISLNDVDELIRAVRKFYLLLPIIGLEPEWPETAKSRRRKLIADHLNKVCQSVTSLNVQTVDRWLTRRFSPRESLKLFGRSLQSRYGNFCFICGKKIKGRKTVDHIFPFAYGGDESDENLILAHPGCNSSKNSMIPGDEIYWAPSEIDSLEDMVPIRLQYLVFLRDNFTCSNRQCNLGLFNQTEIHLSRIHKTGICCYDNLKTLCKQCFKPE